METYFKCGCMDETREPRAIQGENGVYRIEYFPMIPPALKVWRLADGDKTGIETQPAKTFEVHNCKKIIVYQEKMGLRRYYKKII